MINISYAIDHALTLDRVVELVNEGTCEGLEGMEFTSDQLAGQYAHTAAVEGGEGEYPVDAAAINAHLDFLAEAGAVFDVSKAIAHGLAIAASSTED